MSAIGGKADMTIALRMSAFDPKPTSHFALCISAFEGKAEHSAARAQQPTMPVIGYLGVRSPAADAPFIASFHQGLNEAGFSDGKNVTIDFRSAQNDYGRLPALAADLVQRRVNVIVATSTPAALAAKAATATIPIVFETGSDPVNIGLVSSLNRPGSNVTGVT